jgi:putative transposase
MNKLYESLVISKQSFHQYMDRQRVVLSEQKQLLVLIYQIREDHPTMGARDMYFKLDPESMGRDAFELFCKEEGLMSSKARDFRRTTDSTGVVRFENKIEGLELFRIDQVWQSDITYYEVGGRFYYITFVIDGFSRRIVGHSVSQRLLTQHTTMPALKMAIKLRKREKREKSTLIIHSDGGGQYYSKDFRELTNAYNITNSMCEYAWENGKAERVNGVIKNNYLRHREIDSFDTLKKEVDRSVYLYNNDKPHIKLHRKTPVGFETKESKSNKQTVTSNPSVKSKGRIITVSVKGI